MKSIRQLSIITFAISLIFSCRSAVIDDNTLNIVPVLHYSFENNTSNKVLNRYDGIANDITYDLGINGAAAFFNGTTSYINIPFVKECTQFTFSIWFNSNEIHGHNPLFSGDDFTTPGTFHILFWEGPLNYIFKNSTGDLFLNYSFNENEWYNLILTYDTENMKGKVYINGIAVEEYYGSKTLPLMGGGRIGSWNQENRYFSGLIDEVRMYDFVLNDAQVLETYNLK